MDPQVKLFSYQVAVYQLLLISLVYSCQFIFYLNLQVSMNMYSHNLFNFIGTINLLHFTLLFASTSSRYHAIFQFFAISLYLYGASINVNVYSTHFST